MRRDPEISAYSARFGLPAEPRCTHTCVALLGLDRTAAQRKSDLAACGTSINVLLCTIKTLGVVMEPYLPFAAEKVGRMLALEAGEGRWDSAAGPLPEGRALGEAEILFKKLDPAAILGA